MINLREKILPLLSDSARSLLDEIEAYAGVAISFEPTRYDLVAMIPDAAARPAAEIGPDFARVCVPPNYQLTECDIVHELLHIKSKWNDGRPAIAPSSTALNSGLVNLLDNDLDHLTILPETRRRGYSEDYWKPIYHATFTACRDPATAVDFARPTLIRSWLALSLALDQPDLRNTCRAILQARKWMTAARRLVSEIAKRPTDKVRGAELLARSIDLPRGELLCRHYDIRTRTYCETPIAY